MRRTLFVLALIASASSLVASAQEIDTVVQFHHAAEGAEEADARQATPRQGTIITGDWKIIVSASASSSLRSFVVSIKPEDKSLPEPPPEATVTRTYEAGATQADQILLDWPSTELTNYNGRYQIVATAQSHVGGSMTALIADLKVNNPPRQPQAIRLDFPEKVPTVQWSPNPEPDILSYSINRSMGSAPFKPIGTTKGISFQDQNTPQNTVVRYRVVALRKSPVTPTAGVASAASEPTEGFTIPGPGSAQAGVPIPARVAASPAPQRHSGGRFSETLPYEGLPPVTPVETTSVLSSPSRIVERTVSKLPYIALGLLLMVGALHVLRVSRRLLLYS